MTDRHRFFLIYRCALSAFAVAAVTVNAQEPAPEAQETDTAGVGDIVVTARRREERLLDVPVAVTAFDTAALTTKGITRVDDLQIATPSMKAAPTVGRRSNTQYEIRGISSFESLITQDPAVGIYVDEVYRARATGTNQSFFDVSNVQVLYGPQGTLFGRNSTGGAVLINSNRPTDRFEGSLEAGYGNFDSSVITGILNIPVSDTLQIRAAGEHVHEDGYATNLSSGRSLGGTDSWAGRLSIRFKPRDGIENVLIGSIYRSNDEGTPTALYGTRLSTQPNEFGQVPALAGTPLAALVAANYARQRIIGPYAVYLTTGGPAGNAYLLQGGVMGNRNPYEKARNFAISNITTIELADRITLKNVFGYNYSGLEASTDADASPLDLLDTYYRPVSRQVSNELQISGTSSKFNWVVGGLFFRERGSDLQKTIAFASFYTSTVLRGENTSYGLFGQGTYRLTDQLSLTAGARYTWDKRKATQENLRAGFVTFGDGVDQDAGTSCALSPVLINSGACGVSLAKNFSNPSYTLSLDYKPTRDVLLYVAHRYGYRTGGFNSRISLNPPALGIDLPSQIVQTSPFNPEKVRDVEIGFKSKFSLGDVRVRANLALFKAWYTDIQKQIVQVQPGSAVTLVTNAGKAVNQGVELSGGITPVRWLDLDGFVSYQDGEYRGFPSPDRRPGSNPLVDRVPFATPKWNLSTTLTLVPVDDDRGTVSLATTVAYRTGYFGDNALPALNIESRLPSQTNVNLTLGWSEIMGSKISATAWIRNLTDEVQYFGVGDLIPTFGYSWATVNKPRTYGFTMKYAFGR